MTPAEQIAHEVLVLVNRSPRTPSKAALVDCIQTMLDVLQAESMRVTVPMGTTVQPQRPGAFVRVEPNMSLTFDGWTVNSSRPLSPNEGCLAILDWMRNGILTAPRQ